MAVVSAFTWRSAFQTTTGGVAGLSRSSSAASRGRNAGRVMGWSLGGERPGRRAASSGPSPGPPVSPLAAGPARAGWRPAVGPTMMERPAHSGGRGYDLDDDRLRPHPLADRGHRPGGAGV